MSESNDMAGLETPLTGEIPDDAMAEAQTPDDGSSGPSTEAQIISDADLTDIPEPHLEDEPVLQEPGLHIIEPPD